MGMYDSNYSFYTQPGGSGTPAPPDKNTYVAIWDSIFSYNQNMLVAFNGSVYRSLINGNLGNQPDTSPLAWEIISGYVDREPYHDNFSTVDWTPDGSGGFYIDYPATVHLQGTDKNVYAFVSENGVPSEQPLGYGDFLQNPTGDIRILTDIAFDGFVTITRFASIPSGGGGGTNDYDSLINKPELDTTNTTSQATHPNEVIEGVVNLHKISKTGEYSDLNNIPADLYQQGTDLTIKVYSQNNMPAMTTDNTLAIWIDTTPGNGNHVYFIFRRGAGDVVAVDLT